ncbi:MAG: acyltransferase family protein [Microthrixaceae bacterium]
MTAAPHTPPDGAPVHGAGFRPDIQGLRAIAVLIVVLFHADVAGLSGGFVGVDVFFVISGYVITRMLRRELVSIDSLRMRSFYLRRIRRILPALAVLLGSVLVLTPLLGPAAIGQLTRRTGSFGALVLSNMYLAQGTHDYFDADAGRNPLLHIWSLSLEEQFYLLFPLLLLTAWYLTRRARRTTGGTAAVLTIVAVVSLALSVFLLAPNSLLSTQKSDQLAFYSLPSRAWEFVVGAVLALTLATLRGRAANLAAMCGIALIAVATTTFDSHTLFPGLAAAVPVAGTALLLVAGTDSGVVTDRLLSSRPFQWIGDASYSWYLWHWPLIVFAVALFPGSSLAKPAAALLSLIPAAASLRWVETPIRRLTSLRPAATVGLGLACVALPLAAAFVSGRFEAWWPSSVKSYMSDLGMHSYQARPCDEASAPSDPDVCTWAPADRTATAKVVLIGDSNAGHFSEAFIESTTSQGYAAVVQTRASCAFVDLYFPDDRTAYNQPCRAFYESRMAWLVDSRPRLVVMGSVSDSWIQRDEALSATPTGPWRTDPDRKAELWQEGLVRTMRRLREAGIAVMVVHPVPRFPDWNDPELCAPLRILLDREGCGAEIGESQALEYARRGRVAEERAVREVPGTSTLDLWGDLCRSGTCRTNYDGRWWYRNWNHLSAYGSASLSKPFGRALADTLAPTG